MMHGTAQHDRMDRRTDGRTERQTDKQTEGPKDRVRCTERVDWETDFYTPQALEGATLFDNSAAAVSKNQGP